jgi:Flp pilus assembly protein TadG
MKLKHRLRKYVRRGTATVEFAIVAPVFLAMILGVTEVSRMFEVQNQLQVAAREGARTAVMDRNGLVTGGQTTNAKVTQDVKNILAATGLDPNKINVSIVSHDNPSQAFDLDSTANSLKYFELKVSVPYSATSKIVPDDMVNVNLGTKVVFRNAKTTTGG